MGVAILCAAVWLLVVGCEVGGKIGPQIVGDAASVVKHVRANRGKSAIAWRGICNPDSGPFYSRPTFHKSDKNKWMPVLDAGAYLPSGVEVMQLLMFLPLHLESFN